MSRNYQAILKSHSFTRLHFAGLYGPNRIVTHMAGRHAFILSTCVDCTTVRHINARSHNQNLTSQVGLIERCKYALALFISSLIFRILNLAFFFLFNEWNCKRKIRKRIVTFQLCWHLIKPLKNAQNSKQLKGKTDIYASLKLI